MRNVSRLKLFLFFELNNTESFFPFIIYWFCTLSSFANVWKEIAGGFPLYLT